MQSSSWRELKDQGREQYEQGHYEEALRLYLQANSHCASNHLDRQMLLSNIVACRLKLGQNHQALIDAKECVRLNPSWSKAHVRLASAYIANHASNDACNALQTAIRHDPSNATARQMLLQQLQRDRRHTHTENMEHNSTRPDDVPSASQDGVPSTDYDVDDGVSWRDRIDAFFGRCYAWYTSQSEQRRTGLKVLIGLLLLYVSFGGRFGLRNEASPYDEEPFYANAERRNEYRDQHYYDRYSSYQDDSYRRQRNRYRDDSYRSSSRHDSFGGGYYGGNRGYAGDSPPWQFIVIMGVLLYLFHLSGINPLPLAMMLLQGGGNVMMYHGRRPLHGRRLHRRRRGRMGWY